MLTAAPLDQDYTSLDKIKSIHKNVRSTFGSGKTRPLSYRKEQLTKFLALLSENMEALAGAVYADLKKPPMETIMFEIMPIQQEIAEGLEALDQWVKAEEPAVPALFEGTKLAIRHEPVGTVLMIAPWNYPVRLTLSPLFAAIAAGCPAVIKPSEVSENTTRVMAELVAKYLDPEAYVVVKGGVEQSTALLELKWDKIMYTGNGQVGRIVMSAAAKHLTPVILELGGKSPAIVTKNADIGLAASRITHGKFLNNGQTCIAPDYLMVEESVKDELLAAIVEQIKTNWGEDPQKSDSYSRVINARHYKRITDLLDKTGGKVYYGNKRDANDLYLSPTVVTLPASAAYSDSLMMDELFAPVLPVLTFNGVTEAIDIVNAKDTPLGLYVFGNEEETAQVLDNTRSGGACVNDVIVQVIPTCLPFGGCGESGMGAYQGKDSYMAFTHRRSTVISGKPYALDQLRTLPYQPMPAGPVSA
ncbi:Aldehyde/histidinol dehydrogenase [Gaertneriomyces semiglobifer]|nr:Aldehyde/histidinol dehydrogenase [Gaertneriomyces semiglobifer]